MIVKKTWIQTQKNGGGPEWQREGWYLFGCLPLYIRDCAPRKRTSFNHP